MRLKKLRIRNFRCYKEEVSIDFDDLTALIGRNDAGKSTIMEALDIFLNDMIPDKHDASKGGNTKDVAIICEFSDLPERVILDQKAYTTFADEFLINQEGLIEVHKIFNGSLDKPKLTDIFIRALHPSTDGVNDLICLNNDNLKKRAVETGVSDQVEDKKVNAELRKAIRAGIEDLNIDIKDVSLNEENGPSIWKGIQTTLPAFALFKSDRASTDQDSEAQDPLKAAIKEALKEQEEKLNEISDSVEKEVKKIADLTLSKLREMDPSLARTLKPSFTKPNWPTIFKASIVGDEDIPINKRGSGVRRLILLNFFRAKAEKLLLEKKKNSIILAVEEPETSQHPRNQRLLLAALSELSVNDQVIISTHTPMLVRGIPTISLRYISTKDTGAKEIIVGGTDETNKLISQSLGVLPDHSVKLFIGVEGKNDIPFLKNMSKILKNSGEDVPDLEDLEIDGKIIFTPFGGSGLALWCHRLAGLNRPEFHVYDRDYEPPKEAKYQQYIDEVNSRDNCFATCTSKKEAENYIHKDAINPALLEIGINASLENSFSAFDNVPKELKELVNEEVPQSNKWGENRAKEFLCNSAASKMTKEMLDNIDSDGEVIGWLKKMEEMMNEVED